jgi:NDP-sugar pyrophosphorylase family protein
MVVVENGRVERILDEGPAPSRPVRRCLFTGVYLVSPSIADDLPERGCVVRHTLRRLLSRGEIVAGLVDSGPWHDLGTIETYAGVNFGLLDGSVRYPGLSVPFEARILDPLVRVGDAVRLGQGLVAGARSQLDGHGTIERAIVWDGAKVRAPLADAIVTTHGLRVPLDRAREAAVS